AALVNTLFCGEGAVVAGIGCGEGGTSAVVAATVRTTLLAPAPGLNVRSGVPLELNRAIRLRGEPLTVVKSPPINTRTSSIATVRIAASVPAPGVKLRSSEPLELSR